MNTVQDTALPHPCHLTSSCHITWETDLSIEDLWEAHYPKQRNLGHVFGFNLTPLGSAALVSLENSCLQDTVSVPLPMTDWQSQTLPKHLLFQCCLTAAKHFCHYMPSR